MQITLLAPLAATATFVLAGYSGSKMRPFGAMSVMIAVAAGLVTMLPWPRLFQSGRGMRILYAWSAVNVLLITFGIWITGGPSLRWYFASRPMDSQCSGKKVTPPPASMP